MTTLSLYSVGNDAGETIRYLIAPAAIPDERIEAMLAPGEYLMVESSLVDYLAEHLDAPLSAVGVPALNHAVNRDGSHDIDFGSGRVHLWLADDDGLGVRILTGDDYWRRFGRPLETQGTGRYHVHRDASPSRSRIDPILLALLGGVALLAILALML